MPLQGGATSLITTRPRESTQTAPEVARGRALATGLVRIRDGRQRCMGFYMAVIDGGLSDSKDS